MAGWNSAIWTKFYIHLEVNGEFGHLSISFCDSWVEFCIKHLRDLPQAVNARSVLSSEI